MFTARYGLIPYIKQIAFHILKVNVSLRFHSNVDKITVLPWCECASQAIRFLMFWDNALVWTSRIIRSENKYILPWPYDHYRRHQHIVSEYQETYTQQCSVISLKNWHLTLSTFMNDHHMLTVLLITAPHPPGLGLYNGLRGHIHRKTNDSECYSDM